VLSDTQFKNAGIEIGAIEKKFIPTVLHANGRIDVPPQNIVSISVPLGGYLKYTKLMPGMHVGKGETLAVMEDQQYIQLQQDYLNAKTRMAYLLNEYARQKELNQSKASSDKILQRTEADFAMEKINVKSLSERLKLIGINPEQLNENNISKSANVISPIEGFVSKVNVNIGKYAQPSEELFELINPSDIHLALTVFEKDLDKLHIGQKLFAYNIIQPQIKHECEIILIGKNLSVERSTEVHSHFLKYDPALVPGMYMNADIIIKNTEVYAIESDAVVRFENKEYVFTEEGKNYIINEVKTGVSENGFTEIISGEGLLNKGIVVKGAYNLLMAMKNKPEED
ncbi:MAG TPA: efflux RND transporter periplasmic adaptor subunit, partial [Cyclobacteriaceae bacterium]|nr:efflux RND transporter periplasmic adaptor subunit [Cyclobacteriaceae bacterium]